MPEAITRTEKDTLGETAVPADALDGASTQREVFLGRHLADAAELDRLLEPAAMTSNGGR